MRKICPSCHQPLGLFGAKRTIAPGPWLKLAEEFPQCPHCKSKLVFVAPRLSIWALLFAWVSYFLVALLPKGWLRPHAIFGDPIVGVAALFLCGLILRIQGEYTVVQDPSPPNPPFNPDPTS